MKVERLEQITLPGYSFKEREQGYIKSLGLMSSSQRVSEGDDKRKRATVMKIIDLETGELFRMICPSLLVSALEDEGTDYVGKCYEILVTADKLPGKDYKGVRVYEIKCPSDSPPVASSSDTKKPTDEKTGKA